ncbi:hypothetical protein AOL_s00006g507 [Orbilia oligospora ATCC 24927]|uniref:BTB domain-containing protein n=1 Tax=Arthrobotrys oligospora (strain ATCC 24927 / CBS 115.81 / DSM 1491) TaxID=756982 RepID=G1X0V6_ARTOA|nr:hypothetical protein AOL_s00006g507 [Orbilia oligospora ATCC 24927]EGX53246.1 hypothetical protein AOL_s00006g507 [Orbilia oligospora ATCC 24927]
MAKKKGKRNAGGKLRSTEALADVGEGSSTAVQRNPEFPAYDTVDPNFRRPPAQDSSSVDGEGHPTPSESDSSPIAPYLTTIDSSAEKETYVLSSTGDVLVKLSYENIEIRYLVIGHILRVISPIWEKCLDPSSPFKSEKVVYDNGQDMTALHLEDDNPDCLLNLFRCTHFQYSDVPTTLDFHDLKELAIICDKYDCAQVLKPWLGNWLAPWESCVLEPGYEDWLFISKVFNHTNKVEELLSLLSNVSSSLSTCGSYFKRAERDVSVEMIPKPMLDIIIERRDTTVKTLTEGARSTVELLLDSNGEVSKWCSNEACISLAYGSLFRSLKASGLWGLFASYQTWHGSVNDFREKLNGLKYTTINEHVVSSLFTVESYDRYHGYNRTVPGTCNHSCQFITNKNMISKKLKGG